MANFSIHPKCHKLTRLRHQILTLIVFGLLLVVEAVASDVEGQVNNQTKASTSYSSLASKLSDQGDFQAAERMYRKALEVNQRVLGEDHPDTVKSYYSVADMLEAQGDYEEAERLSRKALEINQRVLGEDHPNTVISYDYLASILLVQGQFKAAEPLFRKALKIRLRDLGEDHSHTAASYYYLASNLFAHVIP